MKSFLVWLTVSSHSMMISGDELGSDASAPLYSRYDFRGQVPDRRRDTGALRDRRRYAFSTFSLSLRAAPTQRDGPSLLSRDHQVRQFIWTHGGMHWTSPCKRRGSERARELSADARRRLHVRARRQRRMGAITP